MLTGFRGPSPCSWAEAGQACPTQKGSLESAIEVHTSHGKHRGHVLHLSSQDSTRIRLTDFSTSCRDSHPALVRCCGHHKVIKPSGLALSSSTCSPFILTVQCINIVLRASHGSAPVVKPATLSKYQASGNQGVLHMTRCCTLARS